MAPRNWVALAALVLFAPLTRAVDINDTRLLAMPAVSAKNIAFVYADDLWVADRDGKNPRRLTSDIGVETNPVFSPDGSIIAFTAQYDGNADAYTIPVGGGSPKRLTYHPGPDIVRGFTPDGKSVLFASNRHVFSNRHMQFFTVPLEGGMPTRLSIPWGFEASYSADGKYIAYTPARDASSQWKHYRGGTASRIWIYSVSDHETVEIPQPEGRCNDLDPQWIGDKLYFRSDRAGEYNVFTFEPGSKAIKQITKFTDFPVVDINAGAGSLILEQAGYLHVLEPGSYEPQRLKVGVAADLVETRARFVKGAKYVRGASVSPSGARAVFEFRGEIVTVPAEKGDPRNLTNTPAANDKVPEWSPDGKSIAYVSDATGEYKLHIRPADGKGEGKSYDLNKAGYYYELAWSPDSKKIAYTDNSQSLFCIDLSNGKVKRVASEPQFAPTGLWRMKPAWSPDSKWIAYNLGNKAAYRTVFAYNLEKDESKAVTDGLSDTLDPVFDASGKYLYLLASTDAGPANQWFAQSNADMKAKRGVYLVVLKKGVPSPLARESDEEKVAETPKPKADAKEKDAKEKDAKEKDAKDKKEEKKDSPDAVVIDFDGIDQRIMQLPIPTGELSDLQAGPAGQIYYIQSASSPEAPPGGTLFRFDLSKRKADVVAPGVLAYALAAGQKKALIATLGAPPTRPGQGPTLDWAIIDVAAPPGPPKGKLNVGAIEVRIEPQAEWKQIFEEAWRVNRDCFYDPSMHGADWPAMKKKYEPFLAHLTSAGDLYRVIRWMLSELAVGHSNTNPGERLYDKEPVRGGLLGADYEVANGRYRFKKVYGGLNWTPGLRSPLTAPGVDVKAGEYLLAVRSIDLKPPTELFSLFEGTAGRGIEITVGPNADGTGSRTVTVEPLPNEYSLRNRDWVEGNMRKVHKATNGRVAYVYVPNTAGDGHEYFKRYFFPQVDKDAVIVDERFNGGGQVADYYIDLLRRPFTAMWATRYGQDLRTPGAAILGPKVMLIEENAGSGGDLLPWMFRQYKLGPLVGKRTWGGLVGILGFPQLMDGGQVTAPNLAFWTPEEGFGVENVGVPPDYDVDIWPRDWVAGKDSQLDKAIELALEALKQNPPKDDKRPPYPKRAVPK